MGAGAIGCFCGGRLAANGAHVVLVGRERAMAELSASGLKLKDLDGPQTVAPKENLQLVTDPSALVDCDVILVCVKSAQTAEVASNLARLLGDKRAVIVSMQNGVRNPEVLRSQLKQQIVLGAIVGFNVVGEKDGTYHRTTSGELVIEANEALAVKEFGAALQRAGFEVDLSPVLKEKQWSKLVMNLANAIGALTDVPTRGLLFQSEYRRIMRAVMAEALSVMKAAGIHPAKLGAIPVQYFPMVLGLPTSLLQVVARAQLKIDPEARSSMWQDLSLGRLTEVDDLNGEIVRLARSCGAKAPLNQRIVEIMHDVEKRRSGSPKMSAEVLWKELHA